MRTIAAIVLALMVPLAASAQSSSQGDDGEERVVIPFDFQSEFDGGRYGRQMGDMIWKKLERRGRFIIPESMSDVRDWCQRHHLNPGPDTGLDEMKRIVQDEFGAHVGIWGKIERVPGHDYDVYDFWLQVVDFSAETPRTVYRVKARTKTVSEIPHVYVKTALDKLYGVRADDKATADYEAERRWQQGPNLVKGDFERGRSAPEGWDPLPKYVSWIDVGEQSRGDTAGSVAGSKRLPQGSPPQATSPRTGSGAEGSVIGSKIIRFSFPASVADTSGVLYYSDYFPIEEGATYRFQCRWRTTGSAVKVFIKCYDEIGTRFRQSRSGSRSKKEKREVYRSQQNLKGPVRQWNVHTEEFTPRHTQYTPRWGRVMLYAYHPAGTVDWDDIVVKQIVPPPADTNKIRRPSLETQVKSREMERAGKTRDNQ